MGYIINITSKIITSDGSEDLKESYPCSLETSNETFNIKYKEIIDTNQPSQTTDTFIKYKSSDNSLLITKSGLVNTRMLFVKDTATPCSYKTPLGEIKTNIATSNVEINTDDTFIKIKLNYKMLDNKNVIGDYNLNIEIIKEL